MAHNRQCFDLKTTLYIAACLLHASVYARGSIQPRCAVAPHGLFGSCISLLTACAGVIKIDLEIQVKDTE